MIFMTVLYVHCTQYLLCMYRSALLSTLLAILLHSGRVRVDDDRHVTSLDTPKGAFYSRSRPSSSQGTANILEKSPGNS